ncbi:thermonuclease family protein [Mesorhizobium sp. KR9-304]|uniref:thermonuclease family protein n=1 Tax=Mesorhizobium sp. KR9-304 TaxID=3156614 RepID=UPI0032B40C79
MFGRIYGILALLLVAGAAGIHFYQPDFTTLSQLGSIFGQGETVSRHFPLCGNGPRVNCVVDGDTFWLAGVKIRVADVNTPEVSDPACAAEAALGARATRRLLSLLNAGPFEVRRGWRDEDVYGRKLRTLYRNGESIGEILVAEGLAHEWRGYKQDWCG